MPGAEIVLLEGRIGIAPQAWRRALPHVPASLLICASSLIAASSSRALLERLVRPRSQAKTQAAVRSAAARPARTRANAWE